MGANETVRLHAKEIMKRSVARALVPDDYPVWEQLAMSAWGLPQINRPWDFTALTKDSVASVGVFDGGTMLGGSLNIIKVGEDHSPYLLVHMLGVNADYQGIGVGKRLMEQNYVLIENGQLAAVEAIKLTSDPFDTRNVHLYLHNSKMHSNTYLPDAYKGLSENGGARHKNLPSDRLYYEAKPNAPWVKEGILPKPEEIAELIRTSPQVLDVKSAASIILVETPADYMQLKGQAVDLAADLQAQQAAELTELFMHGYTAVDHAVIDMAGIQHHYLVCMTDFNENDPHCLVHTINSLR